MKLELKHWSAYLPYELKIQLGDGEIKTVIAIKDWVGWCVTYKSKLGETNIGLNSAKPILRQLQELKHEIEHNGKKFVPTQVLRKYCIEEKNCNDYDTDIALSMLVNRYNVNYLPLIFLEKLLEWHFDIFGLIENDLAVDINTLKK